MSSAKSRNFRRRGDDNNDNINSLSSTTTRKSSSKPKKLLSFADDDEEDEGTPDSPISSSKSSASRKPSSCLSKLSSSHKLVASRDRLPPTSSSTASNVLPQAGTYTKEALLELQKNTRTLAKSTSSGSKTPSLSASESKIILKGLLKPTQEDPISQTLRQPQQVDSDEEDTGRNDTENRLASLGLGKSNDYSDIPDGETIKKIRAKRERMRQSRAAAPDYISLDGGSNLGAAEGFSDEEPEFRTRIAMIGKKESSTSHGVFEDCDNEDDDNGRVKAIIGSTSARYRNSNAIAEELNGGVDDEDEEDKIWEEEQFRKGLGKRMDDGTGTNRVFTSGAATVMHNHQQQHQQRPMVYGSVPSIGGALGASQGLDSLSIPQQAEIAMRALQDNVSRLKESHSRTVSSLTKTNENLSSSLMNITSLEKSLSAASEKFIFMQKLRDFVSVICEFLQHKAPYIEELEEQMQRLHEQRASAILERRIADNEDEMMEVEPAVKAAMLVFGERRSSAAAITAATSAAQAASAAMKEKTNLPVKLDEFGRDINQQKRMDMRRRAEARQRRKNQFESNRLSSMEIDGSGLKIEGESSTDESDSESAAYQSNRGLLLQTADQIFSDASEEYSQLSVVKERFERWKKEYSTSYRDAYMSLSAPASFSPYVRLELLKWDPLHEDAGFFDMKWHSLLFNYGLPDDGSDLNSDDADGNLIPELVEKVAIPILHHKITHCWDMLSTHETKNSVSATSLVTNYVPASSEALAELLVAIHTRLADAVADIMVPTWSSLVLKAVPGAARIAAYRFGMAARLMKNICLWKDILALPVLEKLALDELLCGKVLPHVRSIASDIHDAVTRTERIIASLSGVWSGPSVTKDPSHKLRPLVDYLMSLGRLLDKKHASGMSEAETSSLAHRLKKMLVDLNDYDSARDLARSFNLREAL